MKKSFLLLALGLAASGVAMQRSETPESPRNNSSGNCKVEFIGLPDQ